MERNGLSRERGDGLGAAARLGTEGWRSWEGKEVVWLGRGAEARLDREGWCGRGESGDAEVERGEAAALLNREGHARLERGAAAAQLERGMAARLDHEGQHD